MNAECDGSGNGERSFGMSAILAHFRKLFLAWQLGKLVSKFRAHVMREMGAGKRLRTVGFSGWGCLGLGGMSWNGNRARDWASVVSSSKSQVSGCRAAGWAASAEWMATKLGMSEGPSGQNGRRRLEHLFMCKWRAEGRGLGLET